MSWNALLFVDCVESVGAAMCVASFVLHPPTATALLVSSSAEHQIEYHDQGGSNVALIYFSLGNKCKTQMTHLAVGGFICKDGERRSSYSPEFSCNLIPGDTHRRWQGTQEEWEGRQHCAAL